MTSLLEPHAGVEARNKSVVERYFHDALDPCNIELLRELMATDAVLHRPGFDVVGVEAAIRRLSTTRSDYTAFATELSGLIAEGNMVAVRVHHRTRVRPHAFHSRAGDIDIAQEQALEWKAIVQFRLKDGKIVEEWVMRDELAMLLQMGDVTVKR
ncbi:MAG: ester cyclase [Betaproteobacteria bacterium]|nr:ester cyclase [Betaproteobacteria bacterium]